jgi:hypothetical protein
MGYALKPSGRPLGSIDGRWRFLAAAKGWVFVGTDDSAGGGETEEAVIRAAQP